MIVRTGRRLPGVAPIAGVHHPISVVRMAVDDAYGADESREGEAGRPGRGRVPAPSRSPARPAGRSPSTRSAPRPRWARRVYGGPKWTVSPVYEGMLKEEMDAAAGAPP